MERNIVKDPCFDLCRLVGADRIIYRGQSDLLVAWDQWNFDAPPIKL